MADSGNIPHFSEIYGRNYVTERSLLSYHLSLSNDPWHTCTECNTGFIQSSSLPHHLLTYPYDKPFCYNSDDKEFQSYPASKIHKETHSNTSLSYDSNKSYSSDTSFNNDLQTQSEVSPKVCVICLKTFETISSLKRHCESHIFVLKEKRKNFVCDICDESFSSKFSLKNHSLIHSGEPLFTCDVCSRSFSHNSTLTNHYLTHTDEMMHQCYICHKRFARKSALQHHAVLHTGERPFVCLVCKRDFNRKSELKTHMLIHSEKQEKLPVIKKWKAQSVMRF